MSRPLTAVWLVMSLAALGLTGCGPKAHQSDPATARATLGRVLDAWQKGETLETFQATSPPVTVVEKKWGQGVRLLQYELQEEPKPSGFDLLFTAKLSLQDPTGKKVQEKALYTVSTAPALVVIRTEEP